MCVIDLWKLSGAAEQADFPKHHFGEQGSVALCCTLDEGESLLLINAHPVILIKAPSCLHPQACPLNGLVLAKTLFYDFCVLVPNAVEPILKLASHSPLFAYHMTVAFTTLYPFHTGELWVHKR